MHTLKVKASNMVFECGDTCNVCYLRKFKMFGKLFPVFQKKKKKREKILITSFIVTLAYAKIVCYIH